MASDIKSENPLVFFAKTENQMLKNGKSANRNEHQNRKTEDFWHKKQKTNLKNRQNRKAENPSALLEEVLKLLLYDSRHTCTTH